MCFEAGCVYGLYLIMDHIYIYMYIYIYIYNPNRILAMVGEFISVYMHMYK